jgi:hypothetical protein
LVDADGIPIDVDVQSIMNTVSTREAKTADLDVFFGATFDHAGANGKVKKHRKCKIIACTSAQIIVILQLSTVEWARVGWQFADLLSV